MVNYVTAKQILLYIHFIFFVVNVCSGSDLLLKDENSGEGQKILDVKKMIKNENQITEVSKTIVNQNTEDVLINSRWNTFSTQLSTSADLYLSMQDSSLMKVATAVETNINDKILKDYQVTATSTEIDYTTETTTLIDMEVAPAFAVAEILLLIKADTVADQTTATSIEEDQEAICSNETEQATITSTEVDL